MSNCVLMFFDQNTLMPSVVVPEDVDAWKDPGAAERLVETISTIIDAGYRGVKLESFGKTNTGKLIWRPRCDENSPEGRMAMALFEFAKAGVPMPASDACLTILQRIYREQGLKMPCKGGRQ